MSVPAVRARTRALAATMIALILGIAACGGSSTSEPEGAGQADSRDPTPATTSPTPESSPSPTRPDPGPSRSSSPPASRTPTPDAGPITLAFAGDIHFEGELRARLDDPASALDPIVADLSAADLTVVNLETSIGTSGTPEPEKRYTFQAPPAALRALAEAGVDVVTMANNHGVDFGPDGLADSLSAAATAADADPPLSVVGIGADADAAFAPAMLDVRGTTVAVLGASTADDPTADPTEHWAATDEAGGIALALPPDRLVAAVEDARAEADVVVVYVHWGVQGENCPVASQRELASALADAGADVVVGSHAHRLQGAGLLDDTYVAYGLGNFVWYSQQSEATSTTGLLTLTVDDRQVTEASWRPARVAADGVPRFASRAERQRMADDFADLRDCTELEPLDRGPRQLGTARERA